MLAIGFFSPVFAQEADTVVTDSVMVKTDSVSTLPVKKDSAGHQLVIGFDVFHPVLNYFAKDRYGYEITADYYIRKELYLFAEGGLGGSTVNYADLKYNTTNYFARFGINRAIVPREKPKDWDMMFIGTRIAFAPIHRAPATFTVIDSLWGNSQGSLAGKDLLGYWFELVGGMRVEFGHNLIAGWTIRGKFLLDESQFRQLAPLYVAGYGSGDKNVVFDFNLYISYAIRWDRKKY